MSAHEEPSLDDLIDKHKPASHVDFAHQHPRGWEPGVKVGDGGIGEATIAVPAGDEPAWDEHLKRFGYGDVLDFVRVTEVRSWEVFSKEGGPWNDDLQRFEPGVKVLNYVKAKVVRRIAKADQDDVDELKERILTLDPGPSIRLPNASDQWLMVFLSDWQMGKREGGGSRATVERILACVRQLIEYVADLRSIGLQIRGVILCGMGDMIESCRGHYPMQPFQADLHFRQQRAVVRRLLVTIAKMLRPHFEQIIFRAVPGNHGEERKNGKADTCFSDNNDVCIFDQFADIVKEASWADGIDVYTTSMCEPELTMSFEVKDSKGNSVSMGLAHGHQAGSHSKGDPAGKVKAWWKDCSHTRHPIGFVDILNTGHYHHLRVEDRGERRTWFQCPTLDGGSFWWWSKGGSGSVAGMLCYLADPAEQRGWSWPRVLAA